MKILLDKQQMGILAEFNNITKATAMDVIDDSQNNRMIFIVKNGEIALGIGKGGINVQRLSKAFGDKRIELVENADSVEQMITNALFPVKVQVTKVDNERKIAYITIDSEKKGYAIGASGRTINKCRMLVKRYFDFQNIIVS